MRKYLELFKDGFDATIAEKSKPENWPYVGYSPSEGVVFTTILEENTNSECTITKVEVMDYLGNWEELTGELASVHICSGPFPGCYHRVRVYGENLVINNKYNFTFSIEWSMWEGIEDPNNTEYWSPVIKDTNMCEFESLAEEDNGLDPNYPFVIPRTSSEI